MIARAGIEPAYRDVRTVATAAVSVAEAPARVGTSQGGGDGLYVTFNPAFVDGGSPVTGYTARALRPDGSEAGRASAGAAEFKRLAVVRVGGLRAQEGPFRVVVAARNAHGERSASLASAPLAVTAASVPPAVPAGAKARAGARAVTLAWTPPAATGDAEVTGYRITVSDGRTVAVGGRDVLVTQPSGKAMFRVVGSLKPATPYTFTVAAVTAAGTGPAATVTATTTAAGQGAGAPSSGGAR